MTKRYMISKNLNKVFCAVCLLIPAFGWAQFRGQEDIDIVKDVLRRFGKECALRLATDDDIIKRLELENANVRRLKVEDVQKCYENNYSQVIGVFHLYKKLCEDLSIKNQNASENQMARQLIDVSKYQAGIRPFHAVLNDCLVGLPDRKGKPFTVPLAGMELDVHALLEQINKAGVQEPYPATLEPFR